jgi:hypothetical protein
MSTVGFVQPTNFSGQDTREKWLEHTQLAIADDDPVASRLGKEVIGSSASFHWALIFTLTGRMNAEHVAQLKTLFKSECGTRQIVLDLKDLTLVDRDAVRFLERCEAGGIKLKNCLDYIRELITRERC